MAASREARRNFARQCVALILNYGFDGIDLGGFVAPRSGGEGRASSPFPDEKNALTCLRTIPPPPLDWEYPGYEPHAGTPADTANFNLLLDDVRAALDYLGEQTGKYYGLTAALPVRSAVVLYGRMHFRRSHSLSCVSSFSI